MSDPRAIIGLEQITRQHNAVVHVAVGNITTGEDDLVSAIIAAGVLNDNRKVLRGKIWGRTANNANVKTLKIYFGTQIILTIALQASQVGTFEVDFTVIRTGVDTQDWHSSVIQAPAGVNDMEDGTATQDDGAAITVKATAEATATDDVIAEGMLLDFPA
jgi:hypothetical protein